MYCKKCGETIENIVNGDVNPEIQKGEHRNCQIIFRYCNYCGKQETSDNTHYGYNSLVFCQPTKNNCGQSYFDSLKVEKFDKYKDKLPKFNEYLQDIFLNLVSIGEYDYVDVNEEEFINDVNNHDGYIVIYHDSDGRMWYKNVPNNLEILKYIVKSEHRVTLGMGCNQYVECVIYQGEQFEIEID